ncbi:hypothetical protein B0H19DRAFT_1250374 [Mycena capillaripes]|nr:hypothetical protein B0H19DRAFT_1250374 [Mycena capillaripes]
MQLLPFKTREVYQNSPASSCQELAGVCIEDAFILIFILVFVGGLLLLTLGLNFRTRMRRRADQATSNDSDPPSYSSIGFPPSPSHDLSPHKSGSPSPSLDPYHVVVPSLDDSLLLKDEYFSHVPYPERILAPNQQRMPELPSGVGLGLGNIVQAGPSTPPSFDVSLVPPPPAYARRGAAA